jgi:hypothetical protein
MPAGEARRAALRKAIEVGTGASDRQHTRVRSFRNVVLVTAVLLLLLVIAFAAVAAASPRSLPLCFQPETGTVCPAGNGGPYAEDAAVVALIGALGGALAAAVSVRNLRGTSTPYDMPVALSLLKVPAGALTAIGALIAIRGDFVPGLDNLDSQEQILAYALVFGYAQQLLTRLIDDRASSVLDGVPSKDAGVERPALDDSDPFAMPPSGPEQEVVAPPGGSAVPLPRAPAEAAVPQDAEVDVVDLVDTEPVPLVPGTLGEAYDVLRDQHFGYGDSEPDSIDDRFEGVELVDDGGHPGAGPTVVLPDEPYPAADGQAGHEHALGGAVMVQINGFAVDSSPRAIQVRTFVVPGTSVSVPVRADVAPLLLGFAVEFHRQGRAAGPGLELGLRLPTVRGSSKPSFHAAGIALDLNAPRHPLGKRGTFRPEQADRIRVLARKYGLRWGGDYRSRADDMHVEVIVPLEQAREMVRALQAPPPLPAAPGSPVLRKGSSGPKVRDVQNALRVGGFPLQLDGDFGPATDRRCAPSRPSTG